LRIRGIRVLGLGSLVCLLSLPLAAAPGNGTIAGVVVDHSGTPQMGATILVSSEQIFDLAPIRVVTNDHGRFSTNALPSGIYSIKVTLAGFLPVMQEHVQVDGEHPTLLQIVLGSVFSSFEKLRRPPNQSVSSDDWTWVLRSAAADRTVLRWQDDPDVSAQQASDENSQSKTLRARLDVTSGADHPGSVTDLADSPSTDFVYDLGIGNSQLVMAGQYSYEDASSAASLAAEWLPTGSDATGPATTLLVRESRLGPYGPTFRGLRMSHDSELQLGDSVSVRYGAEYLFAGFNGTTSALRPRAEVAIRMPDGWEASVIVATDPWQSPVQSEGAMESAVSTLDAFPTLLLRNGKPILANGLHEELAAEHSLGGRADITAAVFHDLSTHTAVIGRGNSSDPDVLQDYFSEAFAYDGGATSSMGMRVAYREKISDNVRAAIIYAYAGALAPNGNSAALDLREQLATRYRHSVAGEVSATIPKSRTKLIASYKWLNGPAVSHQDPYAEATYNLEPYLSMEIRQPLPNFLPCRMEVEANVGNLLAQGYVPISTGDGNLVLVPSYRYFKGGLSLQF
jgi:hypothetical protein